MCVQSSLVNDIVQLGSMQCGNIVELKIPPVVAQNDIAKDKQYLKCLDWLRPNVHNVPHLHHFVSQSRSIASQKESRYCLPNPLQQPRHQNQSDQSQSW